MHRFLEIRTIGEARLALRSDGALWVLADDAAGGALLVDRGCGWVRARRVRLCHGDRVRVGDADYDADALCTLIGVETPESGGPAPISRIPGLAAREPLRVPADMLEKRRRNPGTGQIEHLDKEHR